MAIRHICDMLLNNIEQNLYSCCIFLDLSKAFNHKILLNNTALQTVCHRFNIYAGSCVALALWRRDGHRQLVTRFGVIRQA